MWARFGPQATVCLRGPGAMTQQGPTGTTEGLVKLFLDLKPYWAVDLRFIYLSICAFQLKECFKFFFKLKKKKFKKPSMCNQLNVLVNLFVGTSSFLKFSNFIRIIICPFSFIFNLEESFLFYLYSCLCSVCSKLFAGNQWMVPTFPQTESVTSLCIPRLSPL